MDKQFKEFKALVPANFRDLMINYWMEDEGMEEDQAIDAYGDSKFEDLCLRVSGKVQKFTPDLGYSDLSINGTLCFENEDTNFVIPVDMLIER